MADIAFTPRQSIDADIATKFPFRIDVMHCGEDQSDVFSLRYRAYHYEGHVEVDPCGQFYDRIDYLKTTVQIRAVDRDVCVGALRISFCSAATGVGVLPCAIYYPEVAELGEDPSRRIVEISRLAIDPEISNTSYRTTLYACLLRAALMAAEASYATDILVATKPESIRLYERMLGCKQLSKPAKYPPGDIEITLLRVPLREARMRQKLQNRFFNISATEISSMRDALGPALCAWLASSGYNRHDCETTLDRAHAR